MNSLDLYDITFAKVTKMGEMKSVKTYDNVYNDMLVSIFESHTGMYTSSNKGDCYESIEWQKQSNFWKLLKSWVGM